jgi:20S proteasome subunit alpha 7
LPIQRYFGTAVGKGRQAAKNEIEKLKLQEMTCRQAVFEVVKL